ncbi:glutaredoxin 2 isoform X2 [Leopardus geoffroyi]|uniref:glutaredoxin 2 isoform X2 n=1 Tax=Leopardus geoffroyi TaxID=46844 RepID=UPI001E265905|nr:glutaredoxin 2 isoform X2 [Leopardus geoffroyi]
MRPAAARAARRGGARRARRKRGRACGGRTRRRRRALRGRCRRALRSPRAGAAIMSWWHAALPGTRLIRRGSGSARQLGRAAGAAASGYGVGVARRPRGGLDQADGEQHIIIFGEVSNCSCESDSGNNF